MLTMVEVVKLVVVSSVIGLRALYRRSLLPPGPKYSAVSASGTSDPEAGPSEGEGTPEGSKPWQWWAIAQFAFPATVYAVVNLVGFAALEFVDPATYKVLLNVRVLLTGFLSAIVLRRRLAPRQWAALILLAAACIAAAPESVLRGGLFSASALGVALVLAQAGLSSLGSVAYQFLAQTGGDLGVDRLQANAVLYACGIPVQLMVLVVPHVLRGDTAPLATAFSFSSAEWGVIGMYVCAGLGTATVITRLGAIAKEFAHSLEMVATPFAQWVFLAMDPPTARILLTAVGAAAALALYNHSSVEEEEEEEEDVCEDGGVGGDEEASASASGGPAYSARTSLLSGSSETVKDDSTKHGGRHNQSSLDSTDTDDAQEGRTGAAIELSAVHRREPLV